MRASAVPVMNAHSTSECFIAYAPRGGGLLCAVVYLVRGDDVCGWWVGRDANAAYPPCFFLLENYYTTHERAFLTTRGGDLLGGWVQDHDSPRGALDPALPIEDAMARELDQLQFTFAREWLVYPEDEDAEEQSRLYADAELGTGAVTVRFQRLGRFDKSQPAWRCFSHDLDYNVIERLMRCWPLDYRTDRQAE